MTNTTQDDRDEEIRDHLSKPRVNLLQLDGWLNYPPGDSIMPPTKTATRFAPA